MSMNSGGKPAFFSNLKRVERTTELKALDRSRYRTYEDGWRVCLAAKAMEWSVVWCLFLKPN